VRAQEKEGKENRNIETKNQSNLSVAVDDIFVVPLARLHDVLLHFLALGQVVEVREEVFCERVCHFEKRKRENE